MKGSASSSVKTAVTYGLSEKAIRDIRSHFGQVVLGQERQSIRKVPIQLKQIGRPKGYRDQKPGKRRIVASPQPTVRLEKGRKS